MTLPYPGTTTEIAECTDCGRKFTHDPFYEAVCNDCLVYYDNEGKRGPIILLTTKEKNDAPQKNQS